MSTPDDRRLAALVANHRRFLAFLERRVGNRADAEEVLQAAFVRAIEHGADVHDDERLVAWFYRVLRNAITDHARRQRAGERALAGRAEDDAAAADVDQERTVCGCIGELANLLPAAQADLIRRIDLEGADSAEVAQTLGISQGNLRIRLHRARAALRNEVLQSCMTCAEHGCRDCTCGQPPRKSAGS